MSRSEYRTISEMVPNTYNHIDNPLTYCIDSTTDQRFLHGGHSDSFGQHSKPCQEYLSTYCSEKWDKHCEEASMNTSVDIPNNIEHRGLMSGIHQVSMNGGETLLYNTAAKKYLVSMGNCTRKYEYFDPTVATSPLISYWVNDPGGCTGGKCLFDRQTGCDPVYGVNPIGLDDDPIMNKILMNPRIARDILVNIFINMRGNGTLKSLSRTKLGHYYKTNEPFNSTSIH